MKVCIQVLESNARGVRVKVSMGLKSGEMFQTAKKQPEAKHQTEDYQADPHLHLKLTAPGYSRSID